MASIDEIRKAQRAEGPATILAIGTATPANCVIQAEYPDYYFRVTKSEHMTDLKEKFQRMFDDQEKIHALDVWGLYALILHEKAHLLGVKAGDEFYVVSKEINKYGGKIIFGDRPNQVTDERGWAKLSFWDKVKWVYAKVFYLLLSKSNNAEDIEREVNECLIVDERDRYMSCLLHKTASEHSSVVAVVGKGHLNGINKYWKQPIDMEELMKVAPPKEGIYAAAEEMMEALVIRGVAIMVVIVVGFYSLLKQTRCFSYFLGRFRSEEEETLN